jgi:hypothetical protein
MECPSCKAYTSGVIEAYGSGDPCPYCGLPAKTTATVLEARQRGADEELTRRFEAAEVRAGKAEARADRLQRRLDEITQLVNSKTEEGP